MDQRTDLMNGARASSSRGLRGSLPFVGATVLIFSGCKHEPPVAPTVELPSIGGGGGGGNNEIPCDPDTIYFTQSVLPLLVSSCAIPGCHDDETHEEGIRFTSYANIMNSDVIDAGDPGSSDMIEAITGTDPDDIMPPPPHEPLSQTQIDLIWTWIEQGALNNSCSSACDTSNVTYAGTIGPLFEAKCTGCHSGSTPQGGLNFTSYAVVNMVALDGRLGGAVQHLAGYCTHATFRWNVAILRDRRDTDMDRRRCTEQLMDRIRMAALLLATATFRGCYYDSEEVLYPASFCDLTNVTWTNNIEPIIATECAIPACHVPGGDGPGTSPPTRA